MGEERWFIDASCQSKDAKKGWEYEQSATWIWVHMHIFCLNLVNICKIWCNILTLRYGSYHLFIYLVWKFFFSEMYFKTYILFYLMPNLHPYINTDSHKHRLFVEWHRCNWWHPTACADYSRGCVSLELLTDANFHPPPSPVDCVFVTMPTHWDSC